MILLPWMKISIITESVVILLRGTRGKRCFLFLEREKSYVQTDQELFANGHLDEGSKVLFHKWSQCTLIRLPAFYS